MPPWLIWLLMSQCLLHTIAKREKTHFYFFFKYFFCQIIEYCSYKLLNMRRSWIRNVEENIQDNGNDEVCAAIWAFGSFFRPPLSPLTNFLSSEIFWQLDLMKRQVSSENRLGLPKGRYFNKTNFQYILITSCQCTRIK